MHIVGIRANKSRNDRFDDISFFWGNSTFKYRNLHRSNPSRPQHLDPHFVDWAYYVTHVRYEALLTLSLEHESNVYSHSDYSDMHLI